MILKIDWEIKEMTPDKAGVPIFWKVPLELRQMNISQLKRHLTMKFCYDIKKIEVIYP